MKCYLFDIDGTLADCQHRLHHIQKEPKDWPSFFADCDLDAPIPHMVDIAIILEKFSFLVFVSGRSDECREATIGWLKRQGFQTRHIQLYMRKAGDHRPDDLIKVELLARLRADGFDPIMAFDDRDRVVAAWRAAGIPRAQVAPGNF